MATEKTSILDRKLDLLYLVFFVLHVPIMFLIDFSGFYPTSIRPQFITKIREDYIADYRDRFFIQPPLWFHAFVVLEAIYHVPLSLWAIGALLRDDPLVPLHLLVWAMETALSTLICCVDAASWEGYSKEELTALGKLYVPYLMLATGMGLDMFIRLRNRLLSSNKSKTQ